MYYFSAPDAEQSSYPIFVMCQGQVELEHPSVLLFNQIFAEKIESLDMGCLTLEAWGIDGDRFNKREFWEHYTLSQRMSDHLAVIHHLESNPSTGWNGDWIFFSFNDGGRLATDLALACPQTLGVVNMMGAYQSYFLKEWDFCEFVNKYHNRFWFFDFLGDWIFSTYLPWSLSAYQTHVSKDDQAKVNAPIMKGVHANKYPYILLKLARGTSAVCEDKTHEIKDETIFVAIGREHEAASLLQWKQYNIESNDGIPNFLNLEAKHIDRKKLLSEGAPTLTQPLSGQEITPKVHNVTYVCRLAPNATK